MSRGSATFTIRFPEPQHSNVVKLASKTGKSISDIIRQATKEYIARQEFLIEISTETALKANAPVIAQKP